MRRHPVTRPRSALRALLLSFLLAGGVAPGADAQAAPAGFREEFLRQFDASMSKFIALAQAMPEEKYGWSPAEGVMPVARVFTHVARYNFLYPSANMGVAAPADLQLGSMEQITGKAEIVGLLTRSREHVRQLARGIPDAQLASTTELYGRNVQQWAVLLQLVAHMNEHLGQSIAYARMNGVVPPWSR